MYSENSPLILKDNIKNLERLIKTSARPGKKQHPGILITGTGKGKRICSFMRKKKRYEKSKE